MLSCTSLPNKVGIDQLNPRLFDAIRYYLCKRKKFTAEEKFSLNKRGKDKQ